MVEVIFLLYVIQIYHKIYLSLQTAVFGSSLRTAEMPDDSPISIDKLRSQLAATLGGSFVDLRRAMLTLESDRDRSLLAKVTSSSFEFLYRRYYLQLLLNVVAGVPELI